MIIISEEIILTFDSVRIKVKNLPEMEKVNLKRGLYRGLVTEVAKTLNKKQPNVYSAIFYNDKANAEKDLFVKLKAEREARIAAFQESVRKAV